MTLSDQDRQAFSEAMSRLYSASQAANECVTLEDAKRAIRAVRDAAINANDVINRVEAETRAMAQRELEHRLEQQVGMEISL